jgi:hypothetical protein
MRKPVGCRFGVSLAPKIQIPCLSVTHELEVGFRKVRIPVCLVRKYLEVGPHNLTGETD